MVWLKLHPRMFQSTAMVMLSRRARWAYVSSLCYASTYGVIPKGALALFDATQAEAKELVDAGLWIEGDGDRWELAATGLFKLPQPENRNLPMLRAAWNAMKARVTPVVHARDGYECLVCRAREGLEVDHIVPLARGGTNDLDNLQTLCGRCNRKKGVSR